MATTDTTKEKKTAPKKVSLDVPVVNAEGKEVSRLKLPEVFATPWNADLVHQVVVSMQANARTSVAHTKDRSEVRGGGKKPWRQKGTGRARHGSIRSPLWRGGGVTFGPRNEKDYSKKVNRKMKKKALYAVLSKKLKDGEILFVEKLIFDAPKAKDARTILTHLSTASGFEKLKDRRNNAAFIALGERSDATIRSFRNFGNISIDEARNLNPLDVLTHKYLIIENPKSALSVLVGEEK